MGFGRWMRSPISISLSSQGTVESRARPIMGLWPDGVSQAGQGCRTGSMPLWPPGVRLAILGQGRAFLHTYLEGQQCRLWLPPSPPASSPPLSCPRRAALALAYSAQTCPNPAQRRQAGSLPLLAPAGRAMSVAGGVRASHGPAGKSSSVAGWDEGHGACLCPLPEEGVLSAAMGGPDPCAPQPGVTVLGSPRG